MLSFQVPMAGYQGMGLRSRMNKPVMDWGASVASHTIVSAPCSTVSGASWPPMSVLTHPGQTELTAMWESRSAAANWPVTPLSAVLEML